MIFENINQGFWNRMVFMSCDFKELLVILQVNKYMQTYYKKFIYKIVFLKIFNLFNQLNKYDKINIIDIKNNCYTLYLFKNNNILNNYFINYNFKRDYDQICKHIQKLYIKHMNTIKESNMEVFDEFLNVLKLYLNFIYFKEDFKPPYEVTYLLNNKSYTLKTKDIL